MALAALFTFPHFYLILGGFLLFSVGVLFVLIHKPKEWYKLHLGFMSSGMVLSIVGIIILLGIRTLLHAYLGIASVVLLIVVIVLGILAKTTKNKKTNRIVHIWGGRFAYIFVLTTLAYGIFLFTID